MRALAVGFVLLYALASARSLVPGLCATQAALARDEAAFATAYCCARPPIAPEHRSDDDRPLKKTSPRCALCQLALGICTPASYAADGTIEPRGSLHEFNEPETIRTTTLPDTNVGRDPPRKRFS